MRQGATGTSSSSVSSADKAQKRRNACVKKFIRYFKRGFADETYIAWEREYKWFAHLQFREKLGKPQFEKLLKEKKYAHIAQEAVRIESRTNLLFSFEKMALRDAVATPTGARLFAEGLYRLVYGAGDIQDRFEFWIECVRRLPRKQTRVLTWPLVTVFGFIADPKEHIFLKPRVTQAAAAAYAFSFYYTSKPQWETYQSLLAFAEQVRKDTRHLKPRDYIDLQSFIWVQGSDEYP
jgi:hypothetical protein